MALCCCKKISALFCKITLNHDTDFYCLNYLNWFSTENKLKQHKNVCKIPDYCFIKMPKGESTSKYVHEEKFMFPFIIYADMESLPEEINTCHNNPKKPSATKKNKHAASVHLLFTHCLFYDTRNKHNYYWGKAFGTIWKRCKKNNQLLKKRNDTIDNRRN